MTLAATDEITRLGEDFIRFLESSGGEVPAGLFHDDLFLDLTTPTWRLQSRGVAAAVAIRQGGHPWPGRVPRWRLDRTDKGFVLEFEETWEADGDSWYCRELMRADAVDGSIAEMSIYCTGDWDSARVAEHAAAVTLIRP